MNRILVALALLGSLPACLRVTNACDEQAGPCLNIDIRGAVGPIDAVFLRVEGNVDAEELIELPEPKELPVALGVLLGDSVEGALSITAIGLLRGEGRGQGTTTANLVRGGRAMAIVELGTGPYCGDGTVNGVEACDDGNFTPGDDCLTTCRPNVCGDGFIDQQAPQTEICDDGNTATETACPYGTPTCDVCNATCTIARTLSGPYCGDGTTNGPESCDDGNASTEAACPYGTRTCTACNATCTATLNLTGPYCGDGITNGPEACDDGNTITETACLYGQATCTQCSSTCTNELNLTGLYCGDGMRNGPERCDDGNNLACGTCDTGCTAPQNAASATGNITAVSSSQLSDATTFTLNDGVNPPTIFEFDTALDGVTAGYVQVAPSGTAGSVANSIAGAINGVGTTLRISATVSTSNLSVVNLANDLPGSLGNQPILETVASSNFIVSGMSGGAGYDCPANTGCTTNADCAPPFTCQGTPRTCQ